jgi:DNA-binding GntR family transcriptional regulator
MITKIFGENCKRVGVIDLLLSHPHSEYTKKDISECAEISRTTLDTFIDELVEFELIEQTRSIGRGKLYRINLNSSITQALNSFQNQLADIEIEKQIIEYEKIHNTKIEIKKPFEEIVKTEVAKEEKINELRKNEYASNKKIFFDTNLNITSKPFNNLFGQSNATGAIVARNLGIINNKIPSLIIKENIHSQGFIRTTED